MSEALRELQAVQFGIETDPGDAVAADTVLLGTEINVEEVINRIVLEEPRGVLADFETADVGHETWLRYQGYADYEQILFPFLTGLDGGVSGVDQGSGGPYLWDFDPGLTAAEALKAATLEWIEDDGSTEHVEREAAYFTTADMEIEIPMAGLTVQRWNSFGRRSQTSTVTAGQSPLSRGLIPGELWTLAVDDSGANLGNTAYGGHFRGGRLSVNFGTSPKRSAKGRTDLDMTGINRTRITGEFAPRYELDATAGDSGELGDWRSGTKRFVRLKATDGTKVVEIDFCAKPFGQPRRVYEDGIALLELPHRLMYDATWGKVINPKVTNQLSGF